MKQTNSSGKIYLDSYILQKDNRIRLPKTIVENMGVVPGETFFDVFLDVKKKEIVLKMSSNT